VLGGGVWVVGVGFGVGRGEKGGLGEGCCDSGVFRPSSSSCLTLRPPPLPGALVCYLSTSFLILRVGASWEVGGLRCLWWGGGGGGGGSGAWRKIESFSERNVRFCTGKVKGGSGVFAWGVLQLERELELVEVKGTDH